MIQSHLHGTNRTVSGRRRDVICIARQTIAGEFAVDLRTASHSVIIVFENEQATAFAHHETIAIHVKRTRSVSRIVVATGQGMHAVKATDTDLANRAFGATRQHYVGVATANNPSCFTNSMQTGGASRHCSEIRTAKVLHDSHQPRSHIDDATGDHEGGNTTRTAFEHRLMVDANRFQTTDAGANDATGAIARFIVTNEIKTGILESFGSGGSGKLHITVVTTSFLSLHTAGSGIKILDLTGNTAAAFASQ